MIGTAAGIVSTVTRQVERGRALAARPLLAGYVTDADPMSSAVVIFALADTCAGKMERLTGSLVGRWVAEGEDAPEEVEWACAIILAAANRTVMGGMEAWSAVPSELRPEVADEIVSALESLWLEEQSRGVV